MMAIRFTKSSGNVFSDIGFDDAEAEELAAKADLLALIARVIRTRKLSQSQAARLCGVDQPTLSKALSGRLDGITIDRLTRWLVTLGLQVEINVRMPPKGRRKGLWGLRVSERASA